MREALILPTSADQGGRVLRGILRLFTKTVAGHSGQPAINEAKLATCGERSLVATRIATFAAFAKVNRTPESQSRDLVSRCSNAGAGKSVLGFLDVAQGRPAVPVGLGRAEAANQREG